MDVLQIILQSLPLAKQKLYAQYYTSSILIEKYTIKKIILEIVSKIGRKPDVSEN